MTTSRKLKRLIEEEEKTITRIAELQDYLKSVREQRKQEEDLEIIRSIRSMKLGARELFDLLNGIQDGTVTMEMCQTLLGTEDDTDLPETNDNGMHASKEDKNYVENERNQDWTDNTRPEGEDNNNDKQHD